MSCDEYDAGKDTRWAGGDDNHAVTCPPQWFFGCSFAAPVEAFLKVNGFPEECDGMGYQDCITGVAISKHGYDFRYDRRMLTLEDEDLHHNQPSMMRVDPGVSPNDKSHAILDKYKDRNTFENDFGGGFKNIRDLREHVLKNKTFPIRKTPTHDWFSGQPLNEM